MSKDYDVAVRWHTGTAASETTTVHVEATTTAAALRLARRGIYLDHPGAAIDKTEIVYLEKPAAVSVGPYPLSETDALGIMRRRRQKITPEATANVTMPLAGGITAVVAPDGEILSEADATSIAAIEDGAVEAGFAQPNPTADDVDANEWSDPTRAAVVAATAPEPVAVEVPVAVFARASTLVAQIANRYGTTAVGAFLDAMDEFMGSKRANAWTGSRLWITVAKVPELKRKAA